MQNTDWKQGLDRLYTVLWGVWGIFWVGMLFVDKAYTALIAYLYVFLLIAVLPPILKKAIKWFYKGFHPQS